MIMNSIIVSVKTSTPIIDRRNICSNECRRQKLRGFLRGWINYYSLADMKTLMQRTDEWLRRRIMSNLLETMEESKDKILNATRS